MAVKYTIVPRCVPPFDRLDALTRYAFGLIYDRFRLSNRAETRDRWRDDNGVYCVYDRAELAREMGVTLPTVRRCMDALAAAGLVYMRRSGPHGAWRYYPSVTARDAMGTLDSILEHFGYLDDDKQDERRAFVNSLARSEAHRLGQCK